MVNFIWTLPWEPQSNSMTHNTGHQSNSKRTTRRRASLANFYNWLFLLFSALENRVDWSVPLFELTPNNTHALQKETLTCEMKKEKSIKIRNYKPDDLEDALINIPDLVVINEDNISLDINDVFNKIKENEDNSITPIIVI